MNNMNYRLLDFEQLSVSYRHRGTAPLKQNQQQNLKKKMHGEYSIFYLVVEFNWPTFFKIAKWRRVPTDDAFVYPLSRWSIRRALKENY